MKTWLLLVGLAATGVVAGGSGLFAGSMVPEEETTQFTGEVKPVLYVSDVEESAPFFRDVLGFEFLGYANSNGSPYYADMAAGSLKFGLHNALNEEHERWVGHQRIYFRVHDVRAHRSDLVSQGIVPGELLERDWMDMFIVRDPDGHQIVFAETDSTRHSTDPW